MTRTTLLTTTDIARIVAIHGLPAVLSRMVDYLEDDYRRWQAFEKTPRLASHSPVGVIELMPICDDREYSFKYVNGHPGNPARGLSTVVAFGVLADVSTGYPALVSELTLTTAIRTAATSVMAARLLARPDSATMALIGNGAQSEFQAIAFHHLMGIAEVRLFDVDAAATDKLVANLAASAPGLRVVRSADAAEAARGADIVTTVTADKTNATILTADMLAPGMHLNAVGGDCPGKTELEAAVLERASVFVEFEPQSRIEGELQQMPAEFQVCELWRVLAGEVAGRRDAGEVTLFDSVGFALEDYASLRLMRDYARELGLGRDAGLIPDMADPKNLFGYMAAMAAPADSKAA
ncbi:ornithine cyclodeaminase [Flavobacterium sp. MXW15]|uniref:Ornithine cyclodeaminase n=1 Tax=Xanthomonas chitinilytica TaxID=2989819 RepID=A0ABT3JX38_9XANT|nr:ornithine cyclodeaminase [Xanthomonas sp. H13-6]MCW4455801.1 ornithine cyclodeaminase [Flavobacterium sp. MXW15]MCW4473016.1 ornithine cyclodeaminase [Xanthomonas sp. H13-6]